MRMTTATTDLTCQVNSCPELPEVRLASCRSSDRGPLPKAPREVKRPLPCVSLIERSPCPGPDPRTIELEANGSLTSGRCTTLPKKAKGSPTCRSVDPRMVSKGREGGGGDVGCELKLAQTLGKGSVATPVPRSRAAHAFRRAHPLPACRHCFYSPVLPRHALPTCAARLAPPEHALPLPPPPTHIPPPRQAEPSG